MLRQSATVDSRKTPSLIRATARVIGVLKRHRPASSCERRAHARKIRRARRPKSRCRPLPTPSSMMPSASKPESGQLGHTHRLEVVDYRETGQATTPYADNHDPAVHGRPGNSLPVGSNFDVSSRRRIRSGMLSRQSAGLIASPSTLRLARASGIIDGAVPRRVTDKLQRRTTKTHRFNGLSRVAAAAAKTAGDENRRPRLRSRPRDTHEGGTSTIAPMYCSNAPAFAQGVTIRPTPW